MAKFAVLLFAILVFHPVLSEDLSFQGGAVKDPEDASYDLLNVNEDDFDNDNPLNLNEADDNDNELDEEADDDFDSKFIFPSKETFLEIVCVLLMFNRPSVMIIA